MKAIKPMLVSLALMNNTPLAAAAVKYPWLLSGPAYIVN